MPPIPRGPLPPTEVTARQVGSRIVIGFALPELRGEKSQQRWRAAELLRVEWSAGVKPSDDPGVFRRRGDAAGGVDSDEWVPGQRVRFAEPVDRGRWDGATLRYAVRLVDRGGRRSRLAASSNLAIAETVGPPRDLTIDATADGLQLEWSAPDGHPGARYNVYRSAPGDPWPDRPLTPSPVSETRLVDRTVVTGKAYAYWVRAALSADGPFSEGETAGPQLALALDRFPPAAPTGLVAVQEGSAVRLFWDPGTEDDVAGYWLERKVGDAGWETVGAQPLSQPSYLDADVMRGRMGYRVIAVDTADPPNASRPSESVEIELR